MDAIVSSAAGISVSLEELLALKPLKFDKITPKQLSHQQGVYASAFKGRGMEFQEVRHYQHGDDIRHMDWRVTARTGKPHVKLYHQERERPIFIVCDFNPSMFFGTKVALKSVIAARFSALLATSFANLGDKVGGLLFSSIKTKVIKPTTKGLLPFFHQLCQFSHHSHQQKSQSMLDVVDMISTVAPRHSMVFFISDFSGLNEPLGDKLNYLSKHVSLYTCLVADAIEVLPPKPNIYAITDGDKEQLLNLNDETLRQHYRDIYQQKASHLKKAIGEKRVYEVTCTDDLNQKLFDMAIDLSLGGPS